MGRPTLNRFLDLLQEGVRTGQHRGWQVCVIRRGEVVADLAEGVGAESHVAWLSAGKPLTAVALGLLHEQGALGWQDPVARHLPAFAAEGKAGITVHHLLTHTAGLRHADPGWPEVDWAESVRRVCAAPMEPDWVPGEKAGYHVDSTWFVLGDLVARISGTPFAEFTRHRIPDRLGLGFAWSEPVNPGRSATGPMRTLAGFYAALLDPAAPLLHPETLAVLTDRHRRGIPDQTFIHAIDWGLGFHLNTPVRAGPLPYGYGRHASPDTFGHGGRQSCAGFADPAHGLAVGAWFDGAPGELAHARRVEALFTALYEDLGLDARPSAAPA